MTASLKEAQAFAFKNGSYLMLLFFIAFQFSTILTTVLSILLGIIWLFTKQYESLFNLLKSQPIACWSVVLFFCFIIALVYGNATEDDALYSLGKYKKFLYIPILMIFFSHERYRQQAWLGFIIASTLTLILSDLKAAGILNLNHHYGSATIKNHITHSIFMGFFAFYCMHKAYDRKPYSKLYLVLFVLSIHNLFFVVHGRTGQLLVIGLIVLFGYQRFTKKGLVLSAIAMVLFLGLFLNFSNKAVRINEGIVNSKAYFEHTLDPKLRKASVAARYVIWDYSLQLIAEKPLFGHGTGSYMQEYNRIAKGESKALLHAHNELIMIGVQLGLLGMITYLGLVGSQFRGLRHLHGDDKLVGQGVLLTLIGISLINCPIYDHAQGHWLVSLIALCFAPLIKDRNIQESYA